MEVVCGGGAPGMVKTLGCYISSTWIYCWCQGGERPCGICSQSLSTSSRPTSIYNSTSSVRLALAAPTAEKEQPPCPGERSVYK